jgi:DNA-binding transcriptional LysR family regulator
MNLRTLDLNLLPVFEAVYAERSLTRASEILHVTQPAVSNALTRMRAHFGDPLFVRSARGMAPTSTAEALIGPVRDALSRLRAGLEQQVKFDPATSTRVFNVAVRDTGAFVLGPPIMRLLEQEAPGIRVNWRQINRAETASELSSGRIDFAIDVALAGKFDMESCQLMVDRYVCAMRPGHPAANRKLTLDQFLSLQHLSVSSRRAGRSIVEDALRRIGRRFNPVSQLSHFLPAIHIVMTSDCVLMAPQRLVTRFEVTTRQLPFEAPPLSLHLYWKSEAGEDPGLRWLRRQLTQAAAADAGADEKGSLSNGGTIMRAVPRAASKARRTAR